MTVPHAIRRTGRGTVARALLASTVLAGLAQATTASAQSGLPDGASVAAGAATVGTPNADTLVVTQETPRAVVNWQGFSIDAGKSVTFVQPDAKAAILNRVTGDTTTTIAGTLTGNGRVYLVNPNGIAITSGGAVNVAGGFVASALDIADRDFLSDTLAFGGGGAGAIVNRGRIDVGSGGFAALLGARVENAGTITVPLGRVALGAAQAATLDLTGDGFLQIALPSTAAGGDALLTAGGTLAGARIELRAAAAADAVRQTVNIPGALRAAGVHAEDGTIVIDGAAGTVAVTGVVDASSAPGAGGSILLGGRDLTLAGARIDASGVRGGTIMLGGGAQGAAIPGITTAATLDIDAASSIAASGSAGTGGTIVAWSNDRTAFAGRIAATGNGGDGGNAEVSGRAGLRYAGVTDLRASGGRTGTLLLDPYDVIISTATDAASSGFSATGTGATINTTTLQNALASANVTVSTGASGGEAGDITVANAISWNADTTLWLNAAGAVKVNAGITASAALGRIVLTAGGVGGVSGAGAITTGEGLVVTVTNAAAAGALSGTIAGPGGLAKWGAGALTLTGANTYTGATGVHEGRLNVNPAAPITLGYMEVTGAAGGATLAFTGGTVTTGDIMIGPNAADKAAALQFSGGNVTASQVRLGGASGAVATGTQNAGTVIVNGTLDAFSTGYAAGSTGTYTLSGGTLNVTNAAFHAGSYGTGTFNQTGGTVNAASWVSVARFAGATGTMNLSGGAFNQTATSTGFFAGEVGIGTVNISGSAVVTAASCFCFGAAGSVSGTAGTLNLNGGTLVSSGIGRSAPATATLNFNGGTLKAGRASTTWLAGLTTATIQSGGAIVDDGGYAVTIGQTIGGTGAFTKTGTGSVTLTGANTNTGLTTVSVGTLALNPSAPATIGTVSVAGGAGGATLAVTGGTTTLGGNLIVGANAVDTAATVQFSGGNLSTPNLWLGNAAGAVATGTHTAGTVTVTSAADPSFSVGYAAGSTGSYTISGGTLNVTGGSLHAGSFGTGTFNQTGGAVNASSYVSSARWSTAAIGTYNLSGGTFSQITNNSGIYLGELGSGTLNVSGTAVVTANNCLCLGAGFSGASSIATANLNGGTVIVPWVTRNGATTGTLNFNGGTLQAKASHTNFISGLTGATIQSGGGTIADGGFAVTVAQALGGVGALTKNGAGTLTLTGANGYGGGTTIGGGTLQLGGSGSLGAGSYAGAVAIAAGATLRYASSATQTLSGAISGAGALIKDIAASNLTLTGANGYSGTTTVAAGTLTLNPSSPSSIGAINVTGGATGATLALTGGTLTSSGAITVGATASDTAAAIQITGGTIAASALYLGGANGAVATGTQSAGTVTLNSSVDAFSAGWSYGSNGTFALSGGTINTPNGSFHVGTDGSGTFNQTGGTVNAGSWVAMARWQTNQVTAFNLSGGTFNQTATNRGTYLGEVGAATFTISGAGAYNGNSVFSLGSGYSSASSSAIVNLDGGTLTVPYVNKYSAIPAAFRFNGGTLRANASTATFFDAITGATILSGGAYVDTNGYTITIGQSLGGAGGMTKSGTGTLSLSGMNSFTGNLAVTAGIAQVTGSGTLGAGSYGGDVAVTGGATFRYSSSAAQTLSGTVSGAGALAKNVGTSTLTLTGTNTYTGGTTIGAGVLQVGGAGTLGGGSYTGAIGITTGASLRYSSSAAQTLSGVVSGAGSVVKDTGASVLTLGGTNSYTGSTTVSAGTLQIGGAGSLGAGSYAGNVGLASGATLRYSSSATQTLSGVISGAGAVVKDIAGTTLTLSGNNTFTGGITVGAGTLQLGGTGTLGAGSYAGAIGVAAGATLRYSSSAAQTLSGTISGAGALTKDTAAATLTLTGANSYSGDTTVAAGTLALNPSAPAAIGAVNVTGGAAGATLAFSGGTTTLAGNLTVGVTGADTAAAVQFAGGSVTVPIVRLGAANGAVASGTLSAGTLSVTGSADPSLAIGDATGSAGTFTMTGGTLDLPSGALYAGTSGTGVFNQTGGTVNAGSWVSSGRYGGAGTYNLSGGQFNQTAAGRGFYVGEAGAGTLNVSGTAVLTTAGCLCLGSAASTGATMSSVTLSGGTTTVPGVVRTAPAGATFTFAGGSLKAAAANANFMAGLSGATVAAGGAAIDSNGYAITIGSALSGTGGLTKRGAGSLILTGANGYTGTTTVDAGNLTLGGSLDVGGGTAAIGVATGASLIGAGALTAASLVTSGGGAIDLSGGNRVGTISGSAGSLALDNAQSLAVGSISTTGTLALRTGAAADITINSGATLSAAAGGTAIVLAAGRNFINNAGTSALAATNGRWLVYSDTPAADTFGSLDSGTTAIWNASYAGSPPASVAAGGNRYLFRYQPTLTFTSLDLAKTYGDDATSTVAATYSVSGYHPGIGGAFAGDDAASAYLGTPSVTSSGSAPTASVAGGPYSIDVVTGSLGVRNGYALAFASAGKLAVTPAPLTITALDAARVYDRTAWSGGAGVSYAGFVNGETAAMLGGALAYGGSAQGAVTAGSYALTASGLTSGNYAIGYVPGTLTINPASLSIIGANSSGSYTGLTQENGYSVTGLVAGDSVTAVSGRASGIGAGNYADHLSGAIGSGLGNYAISYTNGSLAITPAPLTVTALDAGHVYDRTAWSGGAGVSYAGFVNGETSAVLGGVLSYGGSAQGAVAAGSYSLTSAGLTSANYSIGYAPGTLAITPAALTITGANGSGSYTGLAQLNAYSVTGLVSGDSIAAIAGRGHGTAAGSYVDHLSGATGSGLGNYAISYVDGSLTITPAPLTVTALDASRVYDRTPWSGGAGVSYAGFVNGENAAVLGGALTYSGSAQGAVATGSYALAASGLASGNYAIGYISGTLSISPAALSITGANSSGSYTGLTQTNSYSVTGLIDGDSVTAIAGRASGVGAGSYADHLFGATGSGLSNYTISYTDGSLAITPAPLTVTALDASRVYDRTAWSGGVGVSYAGFVNGENAVMLGGALGYGGSAQGAIAAGNYVLTAAGLASGNYAISYVPGTLSINPAPLSVTGANGTTSYTGFTQLNGYSVAGLVAGDSVDGVAGRASGIGAGSYADHLHSATGTGLGNYAINYVDGNFVVTPVPLIVTALDASRGYDGTAWSGGAGVSYAGFVNGENAAMLGGSLTWGGAAQGAVAAGDYALTAAGLTSENYAIGYAPGKLAITPAALSITGASTTSIYSGLAQVNGYSVAGLVPGDSVVAVAGRASGTTAGGYADRLHGATGAGLDNYAISYTNGSLAITPAPLTVTVLDAARAYDGTAWSGGTGVGYAGFVAGENAAALGGSLVWGGSAQGAVAAGSYALTVAGLTSGNYVISYAPGTLAIAPARLSIIGSNSSAAYSGITQTNGYSVTGLVAGDSVTAVAGRASGTAAGSYADHLHGATGTGLGNYVIGYTDGGLAITPVPLTVTALDVVRGHDGTAWSGVGGVGYAGFVNGESAAVLGGALAWGGAAQGAVAVGSYGLSVAGLTSGNYAIDFIPGTLTIAPFDYRYPASSVAGTATWVAAGGPAAGIASCIGAQTGTAHDDARAAKTAGCRAMAVGAIR